MAVTYMPPRQPHYSATLKLASAHALVQRLVPAPRATEGPGWSMPTPHLLPSGDGGHLAVYEAGNPHGIPIVFLHEIMQWSLCWWPQFADPVWRRAGRRGAMDWRGHGHASTTPPTTTCQDSQLWAQDLQRVLTHHGLHAALRVGWSYGGVVIGDYLTHAPSAAMLRGIVLVGATPTFASDALQDSLLMQLLPAFLHPDYPPHHAAMSTFVRALTAQPPPYAIEKQLIGDTMEVPLTLRAALLARTVCHPDATHPHRAWRRRSDGAPLPRAHPHHLYQRCHAMDLSEWAYALH